MVKVMDKQFQNDQATGQPFASEQGQPQYNHSSTTIQPLVTTGQPQVKCRSTIGQPQVDRGSTKGQLLVNHMSTTGMLLTTKNPNDREEMVTGEWECERLW